MASATSDADRAIASLLNNRGALYEGEIFQTLKQSPYIIRANEFGTVDGCLDCKAHFTQEDSYASRLYRTIEETNPAQRSELARRFLMLEMKGKRAATSGKRPAYYASSLQRHHACCYIGICAAKPDFVELIPNWKQGDPQAEDDAGSLAQPGPFKPFLYNSRKSRLPPSAYELDPTSSPYRMPRSTLPRAIDCLRSSCLKDQPYINPHTKVNFGTWRPHAVHDLALLMPQERTQHFSAAAATKRIWQVLENHRPKLPMSLDFLDLQPRIADFKLVLHGEEEKTVFVQHKLDSVPKRSPHAKLNKIGIARDDGGIRDWYFSDTDRFDFLCYQFKFSDSSEGCFFIPECKLPDDFFTTQEKEADFEQFREFWVAMDTSTSWIRKIYDIVRAYPGPRQKTPRPIRKATKTADVSQYHEAEQELLRTKGNRSRHGRFLYRRTLDGEHIRFFNGMMAECARSRSGLLGVLALEHDMGDFVYIRYIWSEEEAAEYLEHQLLPLTIDDLNGETIVVPFQLSTRSAATLFNGPNVTPSQFSKLDSFSGARLLIWNLWSSDAGDRSASGTTSEADGQSNLAEDILDLDSMTIVEGPSYVVVPSEDIAPTREQRDRFKKEGEKDKQQEWHDRTPEVGKLLNTPNLFTDYIVGERGASIFEQGCDWAALRCLLENVATQDNFKHPGLRTRDCQHYRYRLGDVHTRLVKIHQGN